MRTAKRIGLLAGLLMVTFLAAVPASATHSWGGYHWARTSNPFTLNLGNDVSSGWQTYLTNASNDWSSTSFDGLTDSFGNVAKNPLRTAIALGSTDPRRCKPSSGRVEVCDARYGYNGWLGVAQIWVSGSHITQGTVKVNDSYFDTATYNSPAWRRMVMCQEIGHTFGLDHQDTIFNNPNLGTCMDYTSNPAGPPSNEHPNSHDYEELGIIYAHLDSTTTVGAATTSKNGADAFDQKDWGREVERSADGRHSTYERDLGNGNKVLTHVTWAEPGLGRNR